MAADTVDLAAHRDRKRAEQHGPQTAAFAFEPFHYDDDGVGMVDDGEHPICVLTAPDRLQGIVMSAKDALALGQALVDAARQHLFPESVKE